jgi:hypothetical protein
MFEKHNDLPYTGFDLDIYALTDHRDRPTITQFLNEWPMCVLMKIKEAKS